MKKIFILVVLLVVVCVVSSCDSDIEDAVLVSMMEKGEIKVKDFHKRVKETKFIEKFNDKINKYNINHNSVDFIYFSEFEEENVRFSFDNDPEKDRIFGDPGSVHIVKYDFQNNVYVHENYERPHIYPDMEGETQYQMYDGKVYSIKNEEVKLTQYNSLTDYFYNIRRFDFDVITLCDDKFKSSLEIDCDTRNYYIDGNVFTVVVKDNHSENKYIVGGYDYKVFQFILEENNVEFFYKEMAYVELKEIQVWPISSPIQLNVIYKEEKTYFAFHKQLSIVDVDIKLYDIEAFLNKE